MEGNEPKGDPPDEENPVTEKIEIPQTGSEGPPPHVGKDADEENKSKRGQPKLEFQHHENQTHKPPQNQGKEKRISRIVRGKPIVIVIHKQRRHRRKRRYRKNKSQVEQKTMEHPLGLSEVDKTAGEGGAGHGSSENSTSSQSDVNSDQYKKELAQDSTESKDNSGKNDTKFVKPRRMRRRARLVRAPEINKSQMISRSSQMSSENEGESVQGFKKRKRSRPEE
ncbi:hypothetical protein JTB14_035340 [Gonioctena quinquepunctata]|nr:hypothetical protein JTB14_035340 [Gonioctena quinquepunctata]